MKVTIHSVVRYRSSGCNFTIEASPGPVCLQILGSSLISTRRVAKSSCSSPLWCPLLWSRASRRISWRQCSRPVREGIYVWLWVWNERRQPWWRVSGPESQAVWSDMAGRVCTFATTDSGITYCQDAHSHEIQIFVLYSAADVAHRDIVIIDLKKLG